MTGNNEGKHAMTAGPWQVTNAFRTELLEGDFGDLSGANDVSVILLTESSNISTASTTYAALTDEVATGNGYTVGGIEATFTLAGTTEVTLTFTENIVWTASGGSIVAYYAAVVQPSGDVIAFCELDDTPATVTVTEGNMLTIQDTNPVLIVQ